MISVQRAVYSAMEPTEHDEHAANIIGNFVPLDSGSELYTILEQMGYGTIRQLSSCRKFDEYGRMAEASLNIVINPQALQAAEDMKDKLGIPYIFIRNCFGPDRIESEYKKLGIDLPTEKRKLEESLQAFSEKHGNRSFGIGEAVNGSNTEFALTLLEAGADVRYIFKNILTEYDLEMLKKIDQINPGLIVYSGVHPSMNAGGRFPGSADSEILPVDVVIGLDAGYFEPEHVSVCWSTERQTFGFSGTEALLKETEERIREPIPHKKQMHGSYLTV